MKDQADANLASSVTAIHRCKEHARQRTAMFSAILYTYTACTAVMSVVTFVCYGIDKRSAQHGRRRIAEARLHLLALLGGWPGAWAGQQFFRHKTQKFSFRIVFWLIVALHVAVICGLLYLTVR